MTLLLASIVHLQLDGQSFCWRLQNSAEKTQLISRYGYVTNITFIIFRDHGTLALLKAYVRCFIYVHWTLFRDSV